MILLYYLLQYFSITLENKQVIIIIIYNFVSFSIFLFNMRCNILFRNIRWGIIVDVLFERDSPDGGAPARTEARFLSRHEIALNVGDIDEQFGQPIERIIEEMEKFTSHGSGWNAIGIVKVTIQCTHYDSIGGSSFLLTPKWLQNKRALVNVINDKDDKCFLYSISAHK